MKIFTRKSTKECNKKAFEIVKSQVLVKPDLLIGLAVGKTTDDLHKLISNDAAKNPSIWKKIKLFQIDENLGLSSQHSLSFNFEIRKELKNLFKITNPKNIFLIDGVQNPKITIKEGYKFIKNNKGIDLIILGLGPEYDPHIAYNTTGKSSLNSTMRVVDLHPKIVKKLMGETCHGMSQQKAPQKASTKGITLGIKDILETKKALLIAFGKDKAKSVSLALNKKINMKKASASALLLHKDLIVVLDKDAGNDLIK